MPVGDKKHNRRNAAGQPKSAKQPVQSVYDITVKECLVWPSNEVASNGAVNNSDVVYVSLKTQKQSKDELKQQQQRQQLQQLDGGGFALRRDDGTVIDALRGWPRHQQQAGETNNADILDCPVNEDQLPADNKKQDNIKPLKPAAKTKSGKTHKRVVVKEPDDVHVGDLISQRYLHEYMEQRQAEQESERLKREANDKAAQLGRRAAKDRRDIKANKAAQLRAIALADKVETSPHDLWKMDKFTRNARPHLSTFRTSHRPAIQSNGNGHYSRQGSALETDDFNYGPCTCPDQHPYLYSDETCEGDPQLRSVTAACVACAL